MRKHRRVTIYDVAAAAGVAPATVSYVLNNSAPIGEETRVRVLNAVQQLGYSPNLNAASLRQNATRTIGLILPNISNPFYSEVAHGVENVAQEHNYIVTYGNSNYQAALVERYLNAFVGRRVDGVILIAGTREDMPLLQKYGVPAVVVDAQLPASFTSFPTVDIDNIAASRNAVAHLIRLGHRRIGYLTHTEDDQRLEGYRQALQEAAIELDPTLICIGKHKLPDLIATGQSLAEQLLTTVHPPPTAIFGCTDQVALGAIRALQAMGWSVPHDIAVIGFDDIAYASLSAPPLTTVNQPKHQMGELAMRLLQEVIEHQLLPPYRRAILPTELVIRESCGAHLKSKG